MRVYYVTWVGPGGQVVSVLMLRSSMVAQVSVCV